MSKVRKGYPSDVTDEEWWFVLPYLLLCREDAGQREHDLREVFNALPYAHDAVPPSQSKAPPHREAPPGPMIALRAPEVK